MPTNSFKVGESVIRVMDGFTSGAKWMHAAQVIEITDDIIECVVFVDVPRRMKFDAATLENIQGREYGWLEKAAP